MQPQFDNSEMGNPIYSQDANMPNFGFGGMGGRGGWGDLMGAGLMGFGMSQYKNPADAGMGYLNQMQQQLPSYFQPYRDAGQQALPQLQQQYGQDLGMGNDLRSQYGQMMSNPGGVMNHIGQGFQQSPGYQFQTQQALGAANRAAAAGGMLGTPMEQQNIAGVTNQLANQDYYNYLDHGMQMYGQGLQGAQGMYNQGMQGNQQLYGMGYDASKNLGEDMSSALMSQANLGYAGQANQNQSQMGGLGDIAGMLGDFL